MTLYDVFSSRSQFSNTYALCLQGARHIRITEAAPENSLRITLETFGSPITFIPPFERPIVSCQGLSRGALAMENLP